MPPGVVVRNVPIRRIKYSPDESPLWSIIGSILISLVGLTISLPISLLVLFLCPIVLTIRGCLFYIYIYIYQRTQRCRLESLTAQETVYADSTFDVCNSVLAFDSDYTLPLEYFQRILTNKIIPYYPKLKNILVTLPLHSGLRYCWRQDANFAISRHVFIAPHNITNKEQVHEYITELIRKGLPKDKPPWDFQIIYPTKFNRETLVIVRVHRSLADGTSLMQILCHCFADSPTIELPEQLQFGCLSVALNTIRSFLTGPWTFFIWMCMYSRTHNLWPKKETPSTLNVTWSTTVTLPKVIRIKQVTRSTVNCVLLSALAGALRNLLISCGIRRPPDIKVLIPIDIQSRTEIKFGNKSSSVILTLPVSVEGCVPRLWATRKTLETLRTSADSVLFYMATSVLMTLAPNMVARPLLNLIKDKASLQFVSLPGPASHLYIRGNKLKAIYNFLAPPAKLGISITAITYAECVQIGMAADPSLKPAAQRLLLNMENQIDILWKLLLNRRVPSEGRHSLNTISSPICDLELRLSQVQDEIIHLTESKDRDDETLYLLRNEFSELVDELRRRKREEEYEETVKSKARVYNLSKKPSLLSFKNLTTSASINLFKHDEQPNLTTQSLPNSSTCYRKNSYDIIRHEKSKSKEVNVCDSNKVKNKMKLSEFKTGPKNQDSSKYEETNLQINDDRMCLLSQCRGEESEKKLNDGILI